MEGSPFLLHVVPGPYQALYLLWQVTCADIPLDLHVFLAYTPCKGTRFSQLPVIEDAMDLST